MIVSSSVRNNNNDVNNFNEVSRNVTNDNDVNNFNVVNSVCNFYDRVPMNSTDVLNIVDMYFSPTIITPLLKPSGGVYRVRTKIDSGSGAN